VISDEIVAIQLITRTITPYVVARHLNIDYFVSRKSSILHKTRFPAIEEVQQWDSEVFTVRDKLTRDEMTRDEMTPRQNDPRRNDPRRNDPRRNGCDEITRDEMPGDEMTRDEMTGDEITRSRELDNRTARGTTTNTLGAD
jgi:hypothetical protein